MTRPMPLAPADIEAVGRAIRAAIASPGPGGSPRSPLPAGAWEWVTGGKFLRARLLARLSIARRVPRGRWTTFSAAIELVHAASLLHDDVIDGSLLRRHAPALWTVYGPRLAILAGDYLLAAAFDLLAAGGRAFGAPLAAMLAAARATCATEMRRELAPPANRPPRRAALLDHARGKTGPLFAVAAAGLLPPRVPEECRVFWEEVGSEIGLIYQMADDLADANAPSSATGKSTGRDAARGVTTTAEFATAEDVRRRLETLLASVEESPIATAREQGALRGYLEEDFRGALRGMEEG